MTTATRAIRIRAGHYYVLARTPGLSGFQRWGELEYDVVTAAKARNRRLEVVGELSPVATDLYRLGDGHIPECQPTALCADALKWLDANLFQAIVKVDGSKPRTV